MECECMESKRYLVQISFSPVTMRDEGDGNSRNFVWYAAEAPRKDMVVPVSLQTADKRSGLHVARRNALG